MVSRPAARLNVASSARIRALIARVFLWRRSCSDGAPMKLSALAFIAFTGFLSYATFSEIRAIARPLAPTPSEVIKDIVVRNAEDLAGKRASFRILLFTDEFRWRINSAELLDTSEGRPEFTPEMKAVLNDAREIIAVGASSEEIPSGVSYAAGRVTEERRAARRADQIALWVRQVLNKPIPVRKLNVGHHTATRGKQDTSDQRRVVIVLVLAHDDEADIDQALRDAMERETARAPVFESLLTRYSLTTGERFSWVQ
jgi:hypothetical protein